MGALPMPHEAINFAKITADAAARHAENGWPKQRDEAWRFTDLNAIREMALAPAVAPAEVMESAPAQHAKDLIQFINGIPQSIDKVALKGVEISPLSADAARSSALAEAVPAGHSVADFALAHAKDGLAIAVTDAVASPLTLRFDYSGDGISSHAVIVVELAAGARLTILEEHKGDGVGLSAPLMLLRLGAGAELHHARRLIEGDSRHHLGLNLVQLDTGALYHGDMVLAGGAIARSETQIAMTAPDAKAYLNAVYLGRGGQMRDVTSRIDHDAPDGQSFQRVHGILDGRAKAVFQGKVKVARYAQKTDGNQMSRTLLLSRQAEANTKPELEIYADDVACSHGATIGEIDVDQLFYLKSRGISTEDARQLLIEAFLVDVVDALDEPARGWLLDAIATWLKKGLKGA